LHLLLEWFMVRSKATYKLRIAIVPTTPAFDAPISRVPVGILPCRLVQTN